MKQPYCPFESVNSLLMCAGGVQAILENSDCSEGMADNITLALNTATKVWVNDLARIVTSSVAHKPNEKASFYTDVIQNIAIASGLLNKVVDLESALTKAAHTQLAKSQEIASYYLEHREILRKQISEQPESKARLLAYFGDMLAP
jgi:hypothetical protein